MLCVPVVHSRLMFVRRTLHLAAIAASMVLGACSTERSSTPTQTQEPSPTPTKEAFGKLSVSEVEAMMAEAKIGKLALTIFDTNSQASYRRAHLPSAKWVDFNNVKAEDLPSDRDTMLVFYCSSEL